MACSDAGDFVLEVLLDGRLEKRMLIVPDMDFADVDVDLSRHAGRKVKIEIRHVANNWDSEMAFWSKIEVR